jgi:nitrite reductase (NADH) small subunit
MSERRWVRVTACDNIPPREGRVAIMEDREIALFNLGDRFFAIDNRCPHQGGPLSDGIVTGASVVCPLHAWKVNLQTGAVERPAPTAAGTCVRVYATRIEDAIVLVELFPTTDQARSVPDDGTPSPEVTKTRRNPEDERSRGHAA